MLRFFRHIRKKLIEQNKLRTYFLYGFGEILIELQVNIWNVNRKAVNEEQTILASLIEDFFTIHAEEKGQNEF